MIILTIILLAFAAILGLVLAAAFFQGKSLSLTTAIFHGTFAAVALILVVVQAYQMNFEAAFVRALVFLVLAAIGGGVMLIFYHLRGRRQPAGLVVGHAILAVIGFLILLIKAFAGTV